MTRLVVEGLSPGSWKQERGAGAAERGAVLWIPTETDASPAAESAPRSLAEGPGSSPTVPRSDP